MADGHEHDPHPHPGWRDPRRLAPRPTEDGTAPAARPAVRRRGMRWLAIGVSAAVLVSAAAGSLVWLRLNGNIRELPLFGGVGGDAGTERPDAFGRTPINVLVIGSDTRAGAEDCRLGGDCGPGQRADVQMVLHVSADRSHASVLSIPRDTVTDLPACRAAGGRVAAARRGPVNATLRYGPGCTVAAVHRLTGIPLDHFVLADFAGVVRMSDAVGGVPVCVDRAVYDPYSRLRLTAGRHFLKGAGALEYLRSRHAFGDGSDVGRTEAQHLFLAALARRMREGGSPGDPAGLLSLADAATRSLTVDSGLASVGRLAGLARDMRAVPSERFAFTTLPTRPDPGNAALLVPASGADRLFAGITADLPLTVTPTPEPSASAEAAGLPAGAPAGPAAGPPDDETFEEPRGEPAEPAWGRTAADPQPCAKVARGAAVRVGGVAMNPTAAFAASPGVPLSAR